MKKVMVWFLACIMLCGALVGCDDKGDGSSSNSTEGELSTNTESETLPPVKKTEITLENYKEYLTIDEYIDDFDVSTSSGYDGLFGEYERYSGRAKLKIAILPTSNYKFEDLVITVDVVLDEQSTGFNYYWVFSSNSTGQISYKNGDYNENKICIINVSENGEKEHTESLKTYSPDEAHGAAMANEPNEPRIDVNVIAISGWIIEE